MEMSGVQVDWNRLTVREFAEFQRAPADIETQVRVMTKIITALPDGLNPADPETYYGMGMTDWEALANHTVEVKRQAESKS